MVASGELEENPLTGAVASVSVGIYDGSPVLDLDYPEDSNAETDMNVVMTDSGLFIEVQGTAEGQPFSEDEMNALLALAKKGIAELCEHQKRTASITGGYVALADAISKLVASGELEENPLTGAVASVSVGIYDGSPVLDLDYPEDSNAETDMNVVMTDSGLFIEVQGTAEGQPFSEDEMNALLALAKKGIAELCEHQKVVLNG